jgi:hypothetical protein
LWGGPWLAFGDPRPSSGHSLIVENEAAFHSFSDSIARWRFIPASSSEADGTCSALSIFWQFSSRLQPSATSCTSATSSAMASKFRNCSTSACMNAQRMTPAEQYYEWLLRAAGNGATPSGQRRILLSSGFLRVAHPNPDGARAPPGRWCRKRSVGSSCPHNLISSSTQ